MITMRIATIDIHVPFVEKSDGHRSDLASAIPAGVIWSRATRPSEPPPAGALRRRRLGVQLQASQLLGRPGSESLEAIASNPKLGGKPLKSLAIRLDLRRETFEVVPQRSASIFRASPSGQCNADRRARQMVVEIDREELARSDRVALR